MTRSRSGSTRSSSSTATTSPNSSGTVITTISYPRRSSSSSSGHRRHRSSSNNHSSRRSSSGGGWLNNRNLTCFLPPPSRERNFISAFFSLISVGLMAAALSDDEWFRMHGGGCPYPYLGVTWFYGLGKFSQTHSSGRSPPLTVFYYLHGHKYVDCVDPKVADLFHAVMGVSFVCLATALLSFGLELSGPKHGFPKWLRRNAVFSIFTVILCVLIVALTYWLSLAVERLQRLTADEPSQVEVAYSDGFFLIVAAGVNSIMAVGVTLYKASRVFKEEEDRLTLLENLREGVADDDAAADFLRRSELPPGSTGPPPPLGMIMNIPPPPPYAP